MSFSRRTDDSTTIKKGPAYCNDSIWQKSAVKHPSKGVLSGTREKTSESHQQRDGRRSSKEGRPEGVVDEGVWRVKAHRVSEITRTNDLVDAKKKRSDEIHGVLRVPESARNVSSSKKGPHIIQGEVCMKNIVNDVDVHINEISACETNLNNLVSRWSGDIVKFQQITAMCVQLQQLWKSVIENGREIDCTKIWQNCHYIVTEATRRNLARKSCKVGNLKEEFIKFLESTIEFYSTLVEQLQLNEGSKRKEKMSVLMCHHFNIYIGDLYRYREQLVAKPNWGKPRSYYLKAQQLAPKNGKPYNQLAVIAIYAHRRLDAVYYYIRSLMASNPFLSAKESLAALFDETSKKAQKEEERVRLEEERKRKRKNHEHKKLTESEKSKEVWILPWEVDKMEDMLLSTVTARSSYATDVRSSLPSTEMFVPDQLNSEMIKNLVSSVLIIHGKLYTKIGLEQISDAAEKCLTSWRLVLRHQLSVNDTSQFMKMLVLSLFSAHNVAEREQASIPAHLYYCGLAGSFILQFLHEVFLTCNGVLLSFIQEKRLTVEDNISSSHPTDASVKLVGSDECVTCGDEVQELFDRIACYLPLVKIWFDWLSCQWQLWSDCQQEIKDDVLRKFWMANKALLNHLIDLAQFLHYNLSEVVTVASVSLWEDKCLAGFMPLKALLGQPTISTDNASQNDPLTEGLHRIKVILQTTRQLFGEVDRKDNDVLPLLYDGKRFLLQNQPVVSPVNTTPVSVSDTKKTEKEEEEGSSSDSDSVIVDDDDDDERECVVKEHQVLSDIDRLRMEKEQLTRKIQSQWQTKHDIEQVLETHARQEICQQKVIIPKYIVPDTNCFIFDLISIQRLVTSSHFTVVIPLTVLMELEGLMKGSTRTDSPAEGARKAVDYLKQCFEVKERCVKLLTTKGNFLSSISVRSEMTGIQISNDDYILLSSVNLHCKVDNIHKAGEDRIDRYTVALLTDDRNLRVKAYAQEFPVKGLTEFMNWCGV